MKQIAFIGLGVMGYPMAGHLASSGHAITVYNRTTQKAEEWVQQHRNSLAKTPREACENADIVFICVGNDNDLRDVIFSENGILAGLKKGSIIVDHTTTSAEVAKEVSTSAEAQGNPFVDAPVSGGQAGAENGILTVMCGGDENTFQTVDPIMQAYAQRTLLMGKVGSGQLTKMVNQICIGGLVQALAEAVNFAQCADLDTDKVFDVLSKGAAQSWQMENRSKNMVDGKFDYGFAVDWMRKDLSICLEEAKRNGAPLPVTALVDQFYRQVQIQGGNRFDTSSLILNLNKS